MDIFNRKKIKELERRVLNQSALLELLGDHIRTVRSKTEVIQFRLDNPAPYKKGDKIKGKRHLTVIDIEVSSLRYKIKCFNSKTKQIEEFNY